ncbi:NAD-dependent epimerase/dehydratase family protein [Halomonas cupida]|uniref:NAD-dependent epimerase/dehydratase family protein n=1 Tax=Halomonas cupida TaxID=44933 RepID=UPI0039B48DB2
MAMTDSRDSNGPVLVTGATGYVAGWIVKELLDAGHSVHAAVRDPNNEEKVGHLRDIAANSPGHLVLFQTDLLNPDCWAEAMAGCSVVIHTASPFITEVDDPQRELIEPALMGTRNVLEQATRTPEVQRVVLTSSCAAIYTDAIECRDAPGGRLNEDIWNTTASLDYQPYSWSKVVAEREAWQVAEQQSQWQLAVINPSLVIGPSLNANPTSESFRIVRQLADGTSRFGAPRFSIGVVDVRDLALAHVAAACLPGVGGRYIVSGHDTDLYEMGRVLRERFGRTYPLPPRALPRWLAVLLVPMMTGVSRRFVARNVGHPWRADNTRSRRDLGLHYRPMQESMEDMFVQMIERNLV